MPEEATPAEVVAAAPFPVYGVADTRPGRRTLGRYSWQSGRLTGVTVVLERAHGAGVLVQVESLSSARPGPPVADRARFELLSSLDREARRAARVEGGGIEATELRRRELMRPIRARIERVPAGLEPILVAGEPAQFEVIRDGALSAAAAEIGGVVVVLVCEGQALEELELAPIDDPDRYFTPERDERDRRTAG